MEKTENRKGTWPQESKPSGQMNRVNGWTVASRLWRAVCGEREARAMEDKTEGMLVNALNCIFDLRQRIELI